MNTPLVSIIIPVYKVEKYLNQCIDSVLVQDFEDYEIILVDDGSPDRCPEICDEYAQKHTNIRVIHKPNGGHSDARNAGVEVSSGEYITFMDSDDFWLGTNVLSEMERIISAYSHPDIIVSDVIKYYEKEDKYVFPSIICSESYNGKPKYELLHYLYFCHADMKMSACQKFTKRELLTHAKFEKGLLSCEDIDWSIQIYINAKSICVSPIPFYCYRQQREGSITNTAFYGSPEAAQRSFDSLIYFITKWNGYFLKEYVSPEEIRIYKGYLAYQLSIAMGLSCRLESANRADSIRLIESHKQLFRGVLNRKTRKVYRLVKLIGIRNTCIVLGLFLKIRRTK